MKKPLLLISFVVLLLGGCTLFDTGTVDTTTAVLGDPVRLEEGELAVLASEGATLRFDEKAADSRCPLNVDCVWAGEATVRLTWTIGRRMPATFSITGHVGPDGGTVAKDTLGYRFSLLRLDPYPAYNADTDEVEFDGPIVATLRVNRLEE